MQKSAQSQDVNISDNLSLRDLKVMIKSVSDEIKFWTDLRCDPKLPAVDIPFVDEHINLYVLQNNALRRKIASRPMTRSFRKKIGDYIRRFRWKSGLGVAIICCGVICGGYWILCCDGGTVIITTAGAVGGYLRMEPIFDDRHESNHNRMLLSDAAAPQGISTGQPQAPSHGGSARGKSQPDPKQQASALYSAEGLALFNKYLQNDIVTTMNSADSLVNALCAAYYNDGQQVQIPTDCAKTETKAITNFMAQHPHLKINEVHGTQANYQHAIYWAMARGMNVMIYEPKYVDGKLDRVIKRYIIGSQDRIQTKIIVLILDKNQTGPHWNWSKGLRAEDITVMAHRSKTLTDKPGKCTTKGEGARVTRIVDREPQITLITGNTNGEDEKWTALHYFVVVIVVMGILWCCGGAVLIIVYGVMRFNRSSSAEIEIKEEKESEPSVADMV